MIHHLGDPDENCRILLKSTVDEQNDEVNSEVSDTVHAKNKLNSRETICNMCLAMTRHALQLLAKTSHCLRCTSKIYPRNTSAGRPGK